MERLREKLKTTLKDSSTADIIVSLFYSEQWGESISLIVKPQLSASIFVALGHFPACRGDQSIHH